MVWHIKIGDTSRCNVSLGQQWMDDEARREDWEKACGIPCSFADEAEAAEAVLWLREHGYPEARVVTGYCDQRDLGWDSDD